MRHSASASYITPVKSDGTLQVEAAGTFGRGAYTLASGMTYYFPIGGQDSPFLSAHCQWDASIVITSITVQDSNMPAPATAYGATAASEESDYSSDAGAWIAESPTTAYVGVAGAGVVATNGVVAASGGAQGGCMMHITETGARRTRLAVVVGSTGGSFRCATWAKE